MRKIYLSLAILAVSSAAIAQNVGSNRAFANPTSYQRINTERPLQTALGNQKVGGVVLWTNNFSTPSDWTINNDTVTTINYGWKINTGADHSWWANITSVNGGSGGAYAELNNGNPTLNPGTQRMGVTYTMTTAAPIDITNAALNTNNTDQVSLKYLQYGARFNDAQEVYISTNGTTWILVDDNSDKPALTSTGGSAYNNSTTEVINIAPYIAGNATSVWIRFSWTTGVPSQSTNPNVWVTYGWFIDDVSIITNPDSDLTISSPFYAAGAMEYPYPITPLTQLTPITFSAKVKNNGATSQVGSKLDVTVGANTYSSNLVTIAPGASDSLVANTTFTPAATVASYTATYTAVGSGTDDNPADNVTTKTLHVTASFLWS